MIDATKPPDAEEQLRRIVLILRQALYGMADELGREFGMERPCKVCEDARRRAAREQKLTKPA